MEFSNVSKQPSAPNAARTAQGAVPVHLHGLTLIELLVVVAVITVFVAVYLPAHSHYRSQAARRQCVNNLKQVGAAWMLWEGDHCGEFPMAISQMNGGTMELTSGPYAFRHFQVMSNELGTTKFAFCPAESDRNRFLANNFAQFGNSNLSFFVGVVSNENSPTMILAGDHNITNGTRIKNGMLNLTQSQPGAWTEEMHNNSGNVLLADGSVQQDTSERFRDLVTAPQITFTSDSFAVTNVALAETPLQMPVLGQ